MLSSSRSAFAHRDQTGSGADSLVTKAALQAVDAWLGRHDCARAEHDHQRRPRPVTTVAVSLRATDAPAYAPGGVPGLALRTSITASSRGPLLSHAGPK